MALGSIFDNSRQGEGYLSVRFSQPADQERILDFYRENQHKHVDRRKDEIWNERAQNGRVIVIADNEDNIGFASVAYDFEHEGKVTWIELGSTMNQQDPAKKPYEMIKGISLYPFVVASQVLNEFLAHTPEDKIVACIFEDNKAVIHLLNQKTGWNFFEPDAEILKATKTTKDSENPHNDVAGDVWLTATTDTLPHQARLVLKTIDEGAGAGLENKKNGKRVGLDVSSFSLAGTFRAAVEALAHGPVADYLENNPHIGMRAARNYLENHLKSQVKSPHPEP